MAAWRRAIELWLTDADTAKLRAMAQSRTEPASRVERARILLAYREDPSFFAVGQGLGLHHQTVQRCVERAVAEGPQAFLAEQPAHRFAFTFTPKHGSWLNLIEGFFSKLARSVLRHIRVASKQELKDRLMAAVDYFNGDPVLHTWTYKLDKAA